jgi:hypothetical protein
MNPEITLPELIADAQTILWKEVREAKKFREVSPENVRAWIETRITWRMKTHVQRLCRIKYHKKTETEEARYEKQHHDDIDNVPLSDEPHNGPIAAERYRALDDFLRTAEVDFKYKLPIKLNLIDGYQLKDLASWYRCSTSHAGSIFKASLVALREYIDTLPEEEKETALELIREFTQ